MLAAPSLGKRPVKLPNMKSARERTCIKLHSIESKFVIGSSNLLFASLYHHTHTFQSGTSTGWGSEGVTWANFCLANLVRVFGQPEQVRRTWLVLNWANFCFANLSSGIRRTATKLCSGSKKLCSTCSGNIRPIRRTLPLTG